MLFGFPGRTNEYLTKEGVRQIANIQNPVRIALRDRVLKILDKYMRSNEKLKFNTHPNMLVVLMFGKNGKEKVKGLKIKMRWKKRSMG